MKKINNDEVVNEFKEIKEKSDEDKEIKKILLKINGGK